MAHSFKTLKIVRDSVIETFFAKAYVCVKSTPVPLACVASVSVEQRAKNDGVFGVLPAGKIMGREQK